MKNSAKRLIGFAFLFVVMTVLHAEHLRQSRRLNLQMFILQRTYLMVLARRYVFAITQAKP